MNSLASPRSAAARPARLIDERRRALLMAQWRVLLIGAAFLLLALVAMLRIGWVGTVKPAPDARSLQSYLLPERGEITDRNGIPLARAFPAYALWFNPKALDDGGPPLVRSVDEVAHKLVVIFPDLDPLAIKEKLASGKAGYLRRRILPEEANAVIAIGELALELPREVDRHYPQGSLAAHVLGYRDGDGIYKLGMEAVLNDHLSDPSTRDRPIALSIDTRVQGALEDELARGMLAVNAAGAAGIVLDVDTGEVLAMASLPDFDPNAITDEDRMVSEEAARNGEVPRTFNRVTNQVYELGSIFKPLSVAAAIDAGTVTNLARSYQASRPIKIGGYLIRDSHPIGDSLNAPQSLIHSSNIVTAQIADELGPVRLQKYMTDLGMTERPYIELPARGAPIVPHELDSKGHWTRITGMTVSYGHGIAVTPLHLASAYAAMVNGGIWRPATLRKIAPGDAPRGRRVFKQSTSARMNQLMRMIAVYGTGRNADAPGFRVGGKTGSAEKPRRGGYARTSLVSTFAAAFPMDNPRYVIVAMLDEPKGTVASSFQRTAAWNAAPIVGRLVPRIGPPLGVYPDADRDIDLTDLEPLVGGEH